MDGLQKKILFVTGKGGVGKSFVAATLALKAAREGRRVLLAELGERSFFEGFLGLENVSNKPVQLEPNLQLVRWDAESCLREYVLHYLKIERLYNLFFENKIMKTFLGVAPGVRELAILGKVTSQERNIGPDLNVDLIVVDAFASGHFHALLSAPTGLAQVINKGPVGEQSRQMDEILRDSSRCHYVIASLPEELPVSESLELHEKLKWGFGLSASFVLNKLVSMPSCLKQMTSGELKSASVAARDYSRYLTRLKGRQKESAQKLAEISDVTNVPLITRSSGYSMLEQALEKM